MKKKIKRVFPFKIDLISAETGIIPTKEYFFESKAKAISHCYSYRHYLSCKLNGVELNQKYETRT